MNVEPLNNHSENQPSEVSDSLTLNASSTALTVEPSEAPAIAPAPTYPPLSDLGNSSAPSIEPPPIAPSEIPIRTVEDTAAAESPGHTYEVTAYYLNVRTEPHARSEIIKVVKQGTKLEVAAETSNGWLELQGGGFIHGGYAQKSKKEVTILSLPMVNSLQPMIEIEDSSALPAPPSERIEEIAQVELSEPSSIVESVSGLTEAHIAKIFEGTALSDHNLEQAILEIEEEYGINAYFTIAVMKLESGNGKSQLAKRKNNLFGLNAIDGDQYNKAFSFETKGDSVRKFGQLLSKNYVGKGLTTIEKVAKKYCPANSKWSSLVKNIMKSDYRKL